jgi:hypothetical protein
MEKIRYAIIDANEALDENNPSGKKIFVDGVFSARITVQGPTVENGTSKMYHKTWIYSCRESIKEVASLLVRAVNESAEYPNPEGVDRLDMFDKMI